MRVVLCSQDDQLSRLCQEAVAGLTGPGCEFAVTQPGRQPPAADFYLWDFEPSLTTRPLDFNKSVFLVPRSHLALFCGWAPGASGGVLVKPVSMPALRGFLEHALPSSTAEVRKEHRPEGDKVLIRNTSMQGIESALGHVAASDVPVLFLGESGVGKEVLARQLHRQSARAAKPFLKLNCAALPLDLLESELFGYDRGAFTGAFKSKPGQFELADGGTLMLDEIGDMDIRLQAKILHVLQDKEFQRLGGKEVVRVDVRILAATHCDLERAMRAGQFREDLYYRLNVVSVQIPPLRERKDEILPLAALFVRKHAVPGTPLPEITPVLKQALLAYDWPGNIRELESAIRKLLVFQDPEMMAQELELRCRRRNQAPGPAPENEAVSTLPSIAAVAAPAAPAAGNEDAAPPVEPILTSAPALAEPPAEPEEAAPVEEALPPSPAEPAMAALPCAFGRAEETRRQLEIDAIVTALQNSRWNRKRAAALLQIDYKALLYKMKRLGIDKEDGPSQAVASGDAPPPSIDSLEQAGRYQRQAETDAIIAALTATRWNRKRAAQLLTIDYKALLYKMKKLAVGDVGV